MPDDIDPPTWLNLLPVLQTYLMTDRIDPQSFQIGSFGVIVGLSQVELSSAKSKSKSKWKLQALKEENL